MPEPFSPFVPPAGRLPTACRGLTLPLAGLAALVDDPLGASWAMTARGQVSLHNEKACLLLEDERSRAQIDHLVAQVAESRQAADAVVIAAAVTPARHFHVQARPLQMEDGTIMIWCQAQETSAKEHLIEALKDSRALFKSLAETAGDFAWVVDANGCFAYVSGGVHSAGLAAWDLIGRPVSTLGERVVPYFAVREPMRPTDVWIRTPLGRSVCLSVAAVPMLKGEIWAGARGIARDVTEERRAERLLDASRRRDRLLRQVLDAIRSEGDPQIMLEGAARTVRNVFAADLCQILRLGGSVESRGDWVSQGLRPQRIRADCRLRGAIVGSLVLERHGEPWPKEDELLLDRVAEHLALAIAQADHGQALARAVRSDALTGLLTRQAFEAEVQRRMEEHNASGPATGVLVLLALNRFNKVNQAFGYAAGDDLLCAVAGFLNRVAQQGDAVARVGSDEFALWRMGVADAAGQSMERTIRRGIESVQQASGVAGLGVTVAAVTWCGEDEAYDSLLRRADAALQLAKRERPADPGDGDL